MTPSRHERRRLDGIEALGLLGRRPHPVLQRVARLAAAVTGATSAAVHIIDANHQHRVAAINANLEQLPRGDSLCRLVVEQGTGIVTPDATLEDRFSYSSMVHGDQPLRFYASAPLSTELYGILGTVCAWDQRPDVAGSDALDRLDDLASMVVEHLQAERLVKLLAEEATTDPLTDLPNRRMVHDELSRALKGMTRHGSPVTVAFVDLDGFKVINDRHGHEVGDQVLAHVARQLQDTVRANELPGRIGGDEFVVIGGEDLSKVEALARITSAIERPLQTDVGPLSVAASVGVAKAEPDDTPASILARADQAMYRVKREQDR